MSGQGQTKKIRLGVLLSGRGSNFAAIQQAIEAGRLQQAEVAVVISNRPEAPGLDFAKEKSLPVVRLEPGLSRQARDAAILATLQSHQVEVMILAGYDRILGPEILQAYAGRILNIHPSLLPAYGGKGMVGLAVHTAVLDNQEAETGCSVHIVTDVVDGGQILGQARVLVHLGDTAETLAARVLAAEHQLYPQVIGTFIEQYIQEQEGQCEHHAWV